MTGPAGLRDSKLRDAVFLLFFLSGVSGLVYEVVWTRLLTVILGNTVHAVTTVLSVFMGGLALGSFLAGRQIDSRTDPLRVYAVLELGVGLSGLALTLLLDQTGSLYVWMHQMLSGSPWALYLARYLFAFVLLVVPTTLMGATLPVLCRFVVDRQALVGLTVGTLYAGNTLGAAVGCYLAGFVFIGTVGLVKTTMIASAINVVVGLVAWRWRRAAIVVDPADGADPGGPADAPRGLADSLDSAGSTGSRPGGVAGPPESRAASPSSGALVIAVFAISGFASMGYEIVWTRVLVLYMGNSVYAFSAMLTSFLVGLALGSLLVARLVDRLSRLSLWYGAAQAGIGLYILALLHLFGRRTEATRPFLHPFPVWRDTLSMFLTAFVLLLPPTLLMGASFPMAGRLYAVDVARIGRSISTLYTWNTLACIAGSTVVGFAIMPLCGLEWTLLALLSLNLGSAAVVWAVDTGLAVRPRAALVVVLLAGSGAAMVSVPREIVRRMHGSFLNPGETMLSYDETMFGTVMVAGKDPERRLLIDDLEMAGTGWGFLSSQKSLGHLPMLLHRKPERVFVVGFGGGGAPYAVGTHPGVRTVDVAELSREVIRDARFFDAINHGCLADPRFRVYVDDGRHVLLTSQTTYDVISVDLLWPQTAGAGSLYTKEFYQLCSRRLAADGVMVEWIHAGFVPPEYVKMIVNTARQVFPYAALWWARGFGHVLLVASRSPTLQIDYRELERRLSVPAVQRDLAEVGLDDPSVLLSYFIADGDVLASHAAQPGGVNSDDLPLVEYNLPLKKASASPDGLSALAGLRRSVLPLVTNIDPEQRDRVSLREKTVGQTLVALTTYLEGQPTKGLTLVEEALQADPTYPEARQWHGFFQAGIEAARSRGARKAP